MYSGSTFTKFSGNLIGAHQKIDRVARHHLAKLMPDTRFPTTRQILHFEGNNGPDGIKRKSPAVDEPWHYFQPFDLDDTNLLEQIKHHFQHLVAALRADDDIRAAFEAAWLAHAMVDGLTPAHHFPYEEKLVELRGGAGIESRTTIKAKLVLPGDNRRQKLSNNWKMWGAKGLMTTHGLFEWGVATTILPARFKVALPSEDEIAAITSLTIAEWYRQVAQDIAELKLYDYFYLHGWTAKLARQVRRELAPRIIRSVTTVWCAAERQAVGGK
jgi:hypothetical protein